MNFELSKKAAQQLGSREYLIKEGKVKNFLFFLLGVGMGGWMLFSQFVLGYTWT